MFLEFDSTHHRVFEKNFKIFNEKKYFFAIQVIDQQLRTCRGLSYWIIIIIRPGLKDVKTGQETHLSPMFNQHPNKVTKSV
jgi:hypothetical protein